LRPFLGLCYRFPMTEIHSDSSTEPVRTKLESVVVRFAGDSGDGMQLTGTQFTVSTALAGNDLATLPDFPAEIRAPAGTPAGVSGYQIHFASSDVHTPGDRPDVLVAMNPAALKSNLEDLKSAGLLIVNTNAFKKKDLDKAGYGSDPLTDGSVDGYQILPVELTRLTRAAVESVGLDTRSADRCKNFFALGMMYWLFDRSMEPTQEWLTQKFAKKPQLEEANQLALKAGWAYCEATEVFYERYRVDPAPLKKGTYRNISGASACALGLVAASKRADRALYYGSYPITPASEVLHELARFKAHGVITFQAEDEIAAIGAAIGASYAGSLGVTCTSGPGLALKIEALSLAIMVELPLIVIDVQRGGPSTGLPTKTEQGDLALALFGRPSEAPVPVLAASTPADCFWIANEAAEIAIRYMTPVIVLSDGYIANGSEPWQVPEASDLPKFAPATFDLTSEGDKPFEPYRRDESTLSRPWATPGMPGLEHRIGGLEKEYGTGNVSYDPINHERMVRLRAEKVERIQEMIPDLEVDGDPSGELLVLGWGSTQGAIAAAVESARADGLNVSKTHIRHMNPLPANLGRILESFEHVLVPELNGGQLAYVLQGTYLRKIESSTKLQGKPFTETEVREEIDRLLQTTSGKTTQP